jgi:hypothetical protein
MSMVELPRLRTTIRELSETSKASKKNTESNDKPPAMSMGDVPETSVAMLLFL